MPRSNTVLKRQARKIIFNVHKFLGQEALDGVKNIKQVQQRTAKATGVSLGTVQNIIRESKNCELAPVFRTPGKKRPRKSEITEIDSFDQGVIKRCVHNFHLTNGELPTINKLKAKLEEDINFKGSSTSLRRILKKLGFRWQKVENNRKILIEKSETRLKRIEYLQALKKFREEGRSIIYTDESYVHATDSKSDGSDKGLKKPISKGQRLVIVHAGSERGFVPGALLMFKSVTKSGDYHDDMNFDNYSKWLKMKLILNLPENSVVIIDNAPYHNKLQDPAPTSNSKKSEITAWLTYKGIEFDATMLKPSLYNILCFHKDKFKKYNIDKILKDAGHDVLRLPPYHPDLNPIEMAWAAIKGHVAQNNTHFNIKRVMELVEEKCSLMGQKEWSDLCNKVQKIEEEYFRSDHIIDELTEQFTIYTGDTESDTSSEVQSDSESAVSSWSASETNHSSREPTLQLSKKGQGRGEVFGCNECNENIQDGDGRMYKCLQCPNLLMCAACEDSNAHHKHSVVRFPSRRIYDKVKDLFALLQSQFEERLAIRSKSDTDKDINSELDDDDDLNSDDNDKDEEKIIKQEFTEEPSILVKPSCSHNVDSGALETFFEVPVTSTEPETHTDPLKPQHNTHIDIKHKPKKRQGMEEPVYNKTSEPKRLATETFKKIVIKEEPPEDGMDLGQLPDTVIKLEAPDYCEEETSDQSQCTIYGSHSSSVKTENI